MLIARLAKILISLSLALFCLLVAYDNVTDPHSNYEFVQHVMSMDTTFPDNKLMYRSVTNPIFWQIVYALIITTQFVFGVLFLAGAMRMWRMRNASAAEFNQRQDLRHCRRTSRLPPVVFCVHGDRRRMVRHVAVEGLERATILLPLLFDGARHPHLPQHAGWRAE